VKSEKTYCCQRVLYGVKRNIAAKEAHFWDCCSNVGHVARVKRYVNVYLHLYRQQPEMDNQNVDFAYPGKIFADAHAQGRRNGGALRGHCAPLPFEREGNGDTGALTYQYHK